MSELVNIESQAEFTFHYLPDKKYWVDPNGLPLLDKNGVYIKGDARELFKIWDNEELLLPMANGKDYYNPKLSVRSFKELAFEAFAKREPDYKKPAELLRDIEILHDRIHNRETRQIS